MNPLNILIGPDIAELVDSREFDQLREGLKELEPADIAGIYLFLASRDARPITGQAIVVSNGEVMH